MNYNEFIQNILDTRGRFSCGEEYHERHHILPKCMGGTNDEENLIDLYAKEHYEAHHLLAEENPDEKKLIYAWWAISGAKSLSTEGRYIPSAEEYEEAKKRMSAARIGTKASNETRNKLSQARKGKKHSEETKKKLSDSKIGNNNPNYGKKLSAETCQKMSESRSGEKNHNYGKHWVCKEEDVQKRAESNKKIVYQYDLNKKLIKIYKGLIEAENETGIKSYNICKACKGKRKIAGGFVWSYELLGGDAYAVRN